MSALFLAALTASAHASGWEAFEAAFPTNPCPDGWAACLVDGEATDPEPRRAAGLPEPADARVGWFDLQATNTFSPFDDLSARAAPMAPAAAPAAAPVAPPVVEQRVVPETTVAPPSPTPEARVVVRSPEPPSTPEPPAVAAAAPAAAPPAAAAPAATVPDVDPEPAVAAVDLSAAKPGNGVDPADPPHGAVDCDDPGSLEADAMVGGLSAAQVRCLEERVATTPRMTDKNTLSRVLMSHAFASGDREGWERLVQRHLDEIDQSDPDLCYKYALHLAKGGAPRAPAVIRWADVALENRAMWTGSTYKNRVHSLLRLRARAALALWESAEAEHAEAPSVASQERVARTRNLTKVNAREWLDYARVAGKDPTVAEQLCSSAAGTDDYCAP